MLTGPRSIRALLIAATLLGGAPAGGHELVAGSHLDVSRPDVAAFIDQLVAQGFDRAQLSATLAQAEPQPRVLEAITKPAEVTLQWWEYRARFLTSERIDAGARLWLEHRELLDQIALRWQVPPQYLLAVVGAESYFGRTTGHYRVLDALATLAFDYPPRSEYFRSELAQFMLLSREEHFDPLETYGSYAGAMGALQFMPSSYRHFAVSAAGSSHADLWTNWPDIFSSVANYLHGYGWRYGEPVLLEVSATKPGDPGVSGGVTLNETLGALRARGLTPDSSLPDDTRCVLLAAPLQDGISYRAGLQNFYVITRYNRSPLYAMAVNDLAAALLARVQNPEPL
jgi:membrane-bound lytic murein transglycosylase B